MTSNHLILCRPLLLSSIFPSIRVFSNESVLHISPKYWSFSFSISPSNEYSGLISFSIDRLDFLGVQGTLSLAGDGERHIRWPHVQSALSTAGGTAPQPPIAARSRPAASPALPLVPGLSITRRYRPGTLSRHRAVQLPGISPSLPFLISLHVLGTALTFLGGRAVPPRPDRRAVQADAAEPETPAPRRCQRLPGQYTALHAPRSTAHAHPGARWGESPCCATALARPASPGLCLRSQVERPAAALCGHCACALLGSPEDGVRVWCLCACLACSAGAGTPAEGS